MARSSPRRTVLGSLTARLLVVMLLPTAVLGVIAYRDVVRRHHIHDDARTVIDQVALLQASEQLLVPLFREYGGASGLQQAERLGVELDVLRQMVPIDFIQLTAEARRDLDDGIQRLLAGFGDVPLDGDHTIHEWVAKLVVPLAEARAAFDENDLLDVDLSESYGELIRLLDRINEHAVLALADAAATTELAHIAIETRSFVYASHYLTDGVTAVIDSADTTNGDQMYAMVASSGAFDSAIERLASMLPPERAAELGRLRALPSFAAVDETEARWVLAVVDAVLAGQSVASRPEAIVAVSDLLEASFARMTDVQEYGLAFLSEEAALADAIYDDARASEAAAIGVAIAATGTTLALLALVVWSVVRPVRALLQRSQQVREGDLDVPTVRPSGPTDVRTLTQTFNEMVVTLRAFDAQVQRLARGETDLEQPLPGPLGRTLRDSVQHLLDVTNELHRSEAAAVVQARTDALTGLANRTAVLEQLTVASEGSAGGALLYFDLDGFKSVNDTQGHAAGDRILREMGERLRHSVPNHMVARMGGDEFIVLLPDTVDAEQAASTAQDLIRIIGEPCIARDGQLFTLSASAGVTVLEPGESPLECIARADAAVYHAKERGRNRVEVFDDSLAADLDRRAEIALKMRRGLDSGEFFLEFQPIIDLVVDRPVGVEALIRWKRADGHRVGPNEFIPIAETTGVIVAIDNWVIDHAVDILAAWRDDPELHSVDVAINVSGRHIVDGTLAARIEESCHRADVDPRRLVVEITETYLMEEPQLAATVIAQLQSLGVRVSIDDFGTGYSSMSALHELDADILKIDQKFIAGVARSEVDHTIVELVLRLADSLDMPVVAEGVDTEEKLRAMTQMGCRYAQGFHLAVPMNLPHTTAWLKTQLIAAMSRS